MPPRLGKIPGTDTMAFMHTCDTCGGDACLGTGLSFRRALNAAEKGDYQKCKALLGRQYCLTCWRVLCQME